MLPLQGAMGSIPGQGTKILPATWPKKKIHDFCPDREVLTDSLKTLTW